jgi:N6-L-threonylcarbamoyladenine synthase
MTGSGDNFLTLGIESSCDDSAVALLRGQRDVRAELLSSQVEAHSPFGGVIPEFAARMHLEAFLPLMKEAFRRGGVTDPASEIGLIAVTAGPGLMGSLIVGVMAAKALSLAWGVPILAVNHLEGHMFANVVSFPELQPPFLCMIVSGGHTEIVLAKEWGKYEFLGGTRDDAAGFFRSGLPGRRERPSFAVHPHWRANWQNPPAKTAATRPQTPHPDARRSAIKI